MKNQVNTNNGTNGDITNALGPDRSFACNHVFAHSLRLCQPFDQRGVEILLLCRPIPSGIIVKYPNLSILEVCTDTCACRETAADENATSYFPLLDRIAEGHFEKATTDEALYEKFLQTLKDDGHMVEEETLSSYKFALSTRSSAPRIEAHYQFYHTAAEPSLSAEQPSSCPVWVLFGGKQYCSPTLDEIHGDITGDSYAMFWPCGKTTLTFS